MQFRQFLKLPFHHFQNKKEKWLYVLSCSLFFMLFLLIYKPFGLDVDLELGERTISGFLIFVTFLSTMVFFVLYISQFVLRKRFPNINNNLGYFLKWFLIDVSLIVFLNAIIEYTWLEEDVITLNNFMEEVVFDIIRTFFYATIVLLYPVMGSFVFVYLKQLYFDNQSLKTDLDVVTTHYKIVSGNEELIKILDEKGACRLTIPLNNLYAIESKNQYVSIKYKRNNMLIEQSIRTRFSKLLSELQDIPSILRCHRSYAINLLNVQELKTINQKPNIILDESSTLKIPVSKTYLKEIKSQLTKY
ncbi:LytTR family DNA-binding domain-containing protein [Flavivirga algicola]|uniref:LytTR family transcriptional regulator n=1 Tax=Flavivirga algicola TaxID=2729136 RepID=A0ABX1S3N8_9FLAO|nr:LytTR family DNA-binding domain-containing protein [Flavivirga algicola]NMH89828.1 LytTR family transcriptional regulator [Flavivirga algicola]